MIKAEYKIIADHLRSISFLICDGILPDNEGRGYVLRRIMRRAMLQLHKLGTKKTMMHKFVILLTQEMSDHYPELKEKKQLIEQIILDEENKFRETLDNGLKILNDEISNLDNNKKISGNVAFKLYDTYGFPLDLTQDILKEKNITIDIDQFNQCMKEQRQRAKANWIGDKEDGRYKIFFEFENNFGSTNFIGYDNQKSQAQILDIINIDNQQFIILDNTPFYATSGGQKGDDGYIILSKDYKDNSTKLQEINNYAQIYEARKFANNLFVHLVSNVKGTLKKGDKVLAIINSANRQSRAQGHSATHLLHKALKQLIDKNITQKGSNIEFDSFTFDFNLNRALKDQEILDLEDLINFYIRQNFPVITQEMEIKQAIDSGAEAVFGSKYEDRVRVLKIGPSLELCGGTHVKYTGNIGLFKIISENAIASGIRRITAKTGAYAFEYLRLQENKFKALNLALKINNKEELNIDNNLKLTDLTWPKKSYFEDYNFAEEKTIKNNNQQYNESIKEIFNIGQEIDKTLKNKEKQISQLKQQNLLNSLTNIKQEELSNKITFVSHIFENCDAKNLRQITSDYKSKQKESQIIAFFSTEQDKVFVCLAVGNDLLDKFDANHLIKIAVNNINGNGGGGQRNFAMGGGSNKKTIINAISEIKKAIIKNE